MNPYLIITVIVYYLFCLGFVLQITKPDDDPEDKVYLVLSILFCIPITTLFLPIVLGKMVAKHMKK